MILNTISEIFEDIPRCTDQYALYFSIVEQRIIDPPYLPPPISHQIIDHSREE
jgi:hypothetical protein